MNMDAMLAHTILQDIKNTSLRRIESETVYLQPLGHGYTPVVFSAANFTSVSPQLPHKKMIFIDGGNAEIVKTPDYSLHFMRFAAVGFIGRNRVMQKRKEGYVLVRTQIIDGKMCFVTQCYSGLVGCRELCIDLKDVDDNNDAPIAVVANMFRGLHEIQFAADMVEEHAVVVLDRALKPENQWERNAFASLHQKALEKNVIICGLNKTTSLLCNTGENVVAALSQFDTQAYWMYYPVFSSIPTDHAAIISFVKLHHNSRYVFRFELHDYWKDMLHDIVSWLASISNDAVFLGYPYGLIVADEFARVSNREKAYLQTIFYYYAGEKQFALESLNAHVVLDRNS